MFSPIFLATMGVSAQAVFLIAVAVLACLLGAEIAGICILASKIRRAQKQRAAESDDGEYRHYSAGVVLLAAAVGQTGYTVLSILAVLNVLAALVFVVLLFYARAQGLDFVSSKQKAKREEVAKVYAEPIREEAPAQEPAPIMEEGEWQEAYDEPVDEPVQIAAEQEESNADAPDDALAQEAEVVLADNAEPAAPAITEELVLEDPAEEIAVAEESVAEEAAAEEIAVAEEEPIAEEEPTQETAEEAPVAILPVAEVAPAPVVESTVEMPAAAANGSDGNQPYKVVEKVVTETVKEIYKETPQAAAPAAPQNGGLSESVVEKLVDLLDYELRTRHELERAEAEKRAAENGGSMQAFATAGAIDPDEDDEDEDDIDDLDDAASEGDDDRDDEENDTEGDHFTGNERIIGFDEKTGYYIVAHYRKSFEAKLIQSRPNIKQYYSELKNALLSYKGTKNRISWTADSFHNGRTPIAKINVKTRILELYLALDPASLEGTVYRGKDVGGKKKYADTPFQYKIRTPRKFKWALELIQRVCEEKGLSPIDIEKIDYEAQYPFDTTENLVERKLIKEYIREEKPATSFELDPDHVPEVPEEDESVIPANANFSWEFDNERMVETEPDPIPEPEIEPEAEPEPVEEPAPVAEPEAEPAPAAPAAEIYKETVKVTEMRYTERYYADGSVAEQTVSVSEPIEVLAEPVIETEAEEIEAEPEAEEVEATEAEAAVAEEAEIEETAEEEEPEAEEEHFFEDESTVEHEVIFADDSSYGDGVEYAPIVVEAPEEEAEAAEETEVEAEAEAEPVAEAEEAPTEESTEEVAQEAVETFEEEDEAYFDNGLEEIPYEEAAFEEIDPEEEEIYEEESYEEGEAEEIYEEASYEEGEAEEIYEEEEPYEEGAYEEAYEEGEVEEIYEEEEPYEEGAYEEAYEEGEAEEIYEEVYEEEAYEEEVYEEEVYEEEAYEELPEESEAQSFNPSVAVIDICSVEAAYRAGEVVSLDTLKERNLVLAGVSVLKIYASGELGKAFTVEAHQFTMDAIKAISDAHGDVIMVR